MYSLARFQLHMPITLEVKPYEVAATERSIFMQGIGKITLNKMMVTTYEQKMY